MGMNDSIELCLKKTFEPGGRAGRAETLPFLFLAALILLALVGAAAVAEPSLPRHEDELDWLLPLQPLRDLYASIDVGEAPKVFACAVFVLTIPVGSAASRRLQDVGLSGAWAALILPPYFHFVGLLALPAALIWLLRPGTEGENRFGPPPGAGGGRRE